MCVCVCVRERERERHIDRLEQWGWVNLMRFNKSNCKLLHLGQGNIHYQYKLGDERIERSPAKKRPGDTGGWEAGHVPSQPRKPTVSWATLEEARPAGQGW